MLPVPIHLLQHLRAEPTVYPVPLIVQLVIMLLHARLAFLLSISMENYVTLVVAQHLLQHM
jgi:hypothetical protein